MGHIPQTVSIHLNLLHWDDVILVSGGGGISGGPPTVTPYLWILFFKADGSTLQLTDAFKFAGSPVTVPTPGSHGNLGVKSIQIGQPISIPAAIGQWNAVSIQPIPVAPVFQGTVGHDLPGLFGVVALVMIQGSVPEDAAEKGHAAFNQAVAGALADTISHMERKPDTDAIATEVQKQVKQAITDAMSALEKLWTVFSPPDASAGSALWYWDQDAIAGSAGAMPISQKIWTDPFGLWVIEGTLSVDPMPVFHSLRLFLQAGRATSVRNFQPTGSVSLRKLMGL